ncbi:bacillithiol transferase BstA [Bacillus glycinifermentans]|uniref:Putative metal-dependent hydrolase P8828_17075 n=1 Tax=Bacillus glycinifermentans TaxID=1664069 RepID=A0ABU6H911_9BACI|nr:bacillithiol transferase BstA [Bacillus glycinifermentans]MEC0486502.1 bacillithiol transferase BstA [Bacillus glycinifermentans]MEC0494149.1 bacillithiol transferase BstA [Bacillus glycinifermentans]MEC0543170.1 bacillithiol transferase BstA [Bacillus glycinifermentans]
MEDLRYPIGTFQAPHQTDKQERADLIRALKQAPAMLKKAVSGLNDTQLDTPYRTGGWTVRQVVSHIADSHLNGYIRCKLALTEETPLIRPYDEQKWAGLADSLTFDPQLAIELLEPLHNRWAALFEALTDADYDKAYLHPDTGEEISLHHALALYVWHSKHHTAHITSLRDRTGWI